MNFVQFLAAALESRVKRDMGEERFPASGWDSIPLGTYYFSPDPQASLIVIQRVVGEVLQHSLAAFGMTILQDAWARFFQGISTATTPAAALERMRDAASTAIPLPHTMALGPLPPSAEAGDAGTARPESAGRSGGNKRKGGRKRPSSGGRKRGR